MWEPQTVSGEPKSRRAKGVDSYRVVIEAQKGVCRVLGGEPRTSFSKTPRE